MALDPVAVAGIVAGLGAVGWNIWRDRKEKKASRAAGLDDNPTRCAEHQLRLNAAFSKLGDLETRTAVLDTKVSSIEKTVERIESKIK